MRAVRAKDTKPELIVRRLVHGMGYRYRLHRKELPGTPDLVFGPKKKVVFINGCFWHGHSCPRGDRLPKTNRDYWKRKLARNKVRDGDSAAALKAAGWQSLIVWECELKHMDEVSKRLCRFLDKP